MSSGACAVSAARTRLDLLVTGGSDFHGMNKPDVKAAQNRNTLPRHVRILTTMVPVRRARFSQARRSHR